MAIELQVDVVEVRKAIALVDLCSKNSAIATLPAWFSESRGRLWLFVSLNRIGATHTLAHMRPCKYLCCEQNGQSSVTCLQSIKDIF